MIAVSTRLVCGRLLGLACSDLLDLVTPIGVGALRTGMLFGALGAITTLRALGALTALGALGALTTLGAFALLGALPSLGLLASLEALMTPTVGVLGTPTL